MLRRSGGARHYRRATDRIPTRRDRGARAIGEPQATGLRARSSSTAMAAKDGRAAPTALVQPPSNDNQQCLAERARCSLPSTGCSRPDAAAVPHHRGCMGAAVSFPGRALHGIGILKEASDGKGKGVPSGVTRADRQAGGREDGARADRRDRPHGGRRARRGRRPHPRGSKGGVSSSHAGGNPPPGGRGSHGSRAALAAWPPRNAGNAGLTLAGRTDLRFEAGLPPTI